MKIEIDQELDVTGLKCPLPILKTKKVLSMMQSGQILKAITDDLASINDFQIFCKNTGNKLLVQEKNENNNKYIHILMRR